jgi:hypothetical protein
MEVSGQIHDPNDQLVGEPPSVLIRWEAGWALEPVWSLWRRKNPSCPPLKIEAPYFSRELAQPRGMNVDYA